VSGYIASNYVSTVTTATTVSFAVKANSYAVRAILFSGALGTGGGAPLNIYRVAGATLTGGTVLTPAPIRDGAGAASATARWNPTSVSGTSTLVITRPDVAAKPWSFQFAADFLIAPGDAVYVTSTNNSGSTSNASSFSLLFDEYHLARST
jgi:hypothetical protein